MSTLEEKILDGPRVHYCEADNDDIRQDDDTRGADENIASGENVDENINTNSAANLFRRPDDESERLNRVSWRPNTQNSSGSINTGPKGVIEDYKKRSLTGTDPRGHNNVDELEAEFQALLNDDSLLKEYVSKRISDSMRSNVPSFGLLYHLQTGQQLLDAIDKENPNVLVLVHIYTKYSKPCANLNRCLDQLAKEYKCVKFVTLDASVTGLSGNFKENGVPALLAYKSGDLVKSLVQLNELLDKDFDVTQVRELLVDNGLVVQ